MTKSAIDSSCDKCGVPLGNREYYTPDDGTKSYCVSCVIDIPRLPVESEELKMLWNELDKLTEVVNIMSDKLKVLLDNDKLKNPSRN